ncbi:MAG: hypothetical protein WAO13_28840, partial [Pseudolabrys sp.]
RSRVSRAQVCRPERNSSRGQGNTDGWSKWSNGALKPETVVHFAIDEELLDFAKATFAHEAGAVSPLHDDQILYGFALERQTT